MWAQLIRASTKMSSSKSFMFDISSFNIWRYVLELSSSRWMMVKSLVMLCLASILVLKQGMSLTQKSWWPRIELCLRLWYHSWAYQWNIISGILHLTSLFFLTSSSILVKFCTCFLESIRPLLLSRLAFAETQSLKR